jgi:hypothetical protein
MGPMPSHLVVVSSRDGLHRLYGLLVAVALIVVLVLAWHQVRELTRKVPLWVAPTEVAAVWSVAR